MPVCHDQRFHTWSLAPQQRAVEATATALHAQLPYEPLRQKLGEPGPVDLSCVGQVPV